MLEILPKFSDPTITSQPINEEKNEGREILIGQVFLLLITATLN